MNANDADFEAYYHDQSRLLNILQTLEQHYDRKVDDLQTRLNQADAHRREMHRDLESIRRFLESFEKDLNTRQIELRLAFRILGDYKEIFAEVLERLEALETNQKPQLVTELLGYLTAGEEEDDA